MPRWSPIVLALAAALCLAHPAAAYTYGDTLTLIWRPLPNLPALARPGDSLTVWAHAPSNASNWSASLGFGSLNVPLTPAGGAWQPNLGRWVLRFQVPLGTNDEIYDLSLSCDSAGTDVARHAVKVLKQYRSDFIFAQISDTHMPEHKFSKAGVIDTSDTTGMADFNAVAEDLNLIHPEFILHTGDLVNEGELEEYLGMHEMGRAQGMLSRLRDPIFVASGNHDIGGWDPTEPPPGTSRKEWWHYFGWPFLANPPAGDPNHSQNFSFDYGLLHCIGLEAYQNDRSYDDYLTAIYGAQSMTTEQMSWLAADVAAVPAGRTKLAFFHYDFGGTLPNGLAAPNFTQFADLGALGLDGVIWGHNHGVAEGNRTAHPFNLGLQSVIDRRAYRIFRVSNGVISPGPMHRAGGAANSPIDSLTTVWSGPNDGSRVNLSATVTNRFGETWDRARLVFVMADHDSMYAASGGTVTELLRVNGKLNVYVDCVLPASSTVTINVHPTGPLGVGRQPGSTFGFALDAPHPNPFSLRRAPLAIHFSLPAAGSADLGIYDVSGRLVAMVFRGEAEAGVHTATWGGKRTNGAPAGAGVYWVRLKANGGEKRQKINVLK